MLCVFPYLGDVSEVKQVVCLGWSWKKRGCDGVIQFQGGLSQNVSDGLHLLLKPLQLLINHGTVDALDLGLLCAETVELTEFGTSHR